MIEPLLNLNHRGRTIARVSVNPDKIIREIELGTSSLDNRIKAANEFCAAGYKTGILIAPIVLVDGWQALYLDLLDKLNDNLSVKIKQNMFIEIIFMTYSYIHRVINNDAFQDAVELYDKSLMTGRGRGKYTYNATARAEAEEFLRREIGKRFGEEKILYIV